MSDRHFDELATRFAEKIYGGAKGAIRLAVLQADLAEALPDRPLRVLDIGAGLGHMALWLAERGHLVTLAEPAEPMLAGARARFAAAAQPATFIQAPWQELLGQLEQPYDLVVCHAVLEWLAEPQAILPVLQQLCAPGGWLSLAFYNKDALIPQPAQGPFPQAAQGRIRRGKTEPDAAATDRSARAGGATRGPLAGRKSEWRAGFPRLYAA